MELTKVLKYSPSSASFMWGDIVFTQYGGGCLRRFYLTSHGLRSGIAAKYEVLGELNEENYENTIQTPDAHNTPLKDYDREKVLKGPLAVYPGAVFSGRADFITYHNELQHPIVHENKSSDSKNTRREVIRKGVPKWDNVAQIVSYMLYMQIPYGILRYDYYECVKGGSVTNKKDWRQKEGRYFEIEFDDDGQILVDTVRSQYNTSHLLAHQKATMHHVENDLIGPRPNNWNAKFGSPCHWCWVKEVCNMYDAGEITSSREFLLTAKAMLD